MENKEVRQYLINFVENTLTECKSFSKVYGKEFVKEKLEENVKKQQFKDYMNNMTNNSKEYIEQTKRKQFQKQNEIKNIDELDL